MEINTEITDGKVYICEYCGLVTTFEQAMKIHMQKHLDEIEKNRNTPHQNWREYEFSGKEITFAEPVDEEEQACEICIHEDPNKQCGTIVVNGECDGFERKPLTKA